MGIATSNAFLSTIASRTDSVPANIVIDVEAKSPCRVIDKGRYFFRNKHNSKNSNTYSYARTNWMNTITSTNTPDSFHVLLIGDEQCGQSIRITLASQLALTIEYFEARSGNYALRIIDSEEIDLIIFGDGIIDMNGLEFLDRLNRKCGKHKIPVIEILNADTAKAGVQVMKMGAHDYLVKDSDGQYFELLAILVSRIYAEQETMSLLRKTTGVQQTVTDNTPSVIYQLSLQGGRHDVRISPQILELGISPDKWGNDAELHHQLCHAEDRPTVRKALEYSYQTGTNFQCEYRINTFGDTLHWFHDEAKVVMDRYGRPLFLQGVMTDITALKVLETEVMRYRGMLEKMVSQRTEMLDRRITILESCNSSLSENYEKMRQGYLDVLRKVQEHEVGINSVVANSDSAA